MMEGMLTGSAETRTSYILSSLGRQPDCLLIVDDNPDSLYLLGGILLEAGYEVEFAKDGLSALEWTGLRKFDAILLDVRMPGMSGFEVSSLIRTSQMNRETPVIFLTGYNDIGNLSKGFETGGADYVTKLFRKRELLARIKAKVDEGKADRPDEILNSLRRKLLR